MPQRGAQIVRNRIGKRFELFVGCLQLRGTISYPLFQLFIKSPNLLFSTTTFSDVCVYLKDPLGPALPISMQYPGACNYEALAISRGMNKLASPLAICKK